MLRTTAASDVPAALSTSSAGRAFQTRLDAFLATYGQRTDDFDISTPRWWKTPTTPIVTIQGCLARSDYDPGRRLASLAADREQAIASTRERLSGYPETVAVEFDRLLAAAQAANWLSEEHTHWMDYAALDETRRVALALGHSLTGTALRSPQDVFYLSVEELRAVVDHTATFDVDAAVSERAGALAHFRQIIPPVSIGAEPVASEEGDDPFSRAMAKFPGTPVEQSSNASLVRGHPGSPGVARGRALVAMTLAEAASLHRGEVLVTLATAPAWTSLFATAAAVVTDIGDVLSHCAVVAREYGLPAVVGCGTATSAIQTGQLLEVDGSNGVVRILPD